MDALAVLNESITAWRRTRHPRWGQLADWASVRALAEAEPRPVVGAGARKADHEAWAKLEADGHVLDLPRLVAALLGPRSPQAAERVAVLALRDDPRLVALLMKVLEAPPFRARTALPFFRAVCQALIDSRDVRARDAMRELSGRFKAVLETSMGDEVAGLLRRSANTMDELPPPALAPADEARLGELEHDFEDERRAIASAASDRKSARKTDEELLAAVYAAPADDGPRMVFADALLERGDPRGEFIQLQLQRARGEGTDATLDRERELATPKNRTAWALPIANGGTCTLARGFPRSVVVDSRTVKRILGIDAWATIEELKGMEGLSLKQANELLAAPSTRFLRSVGRLKAPPASTGPLPWREVSLVFLPSRDFLERLPSLERLSVDANRESVWEAGVLRSAPKVTHFAMRTGPLPDFAELAGLESLELEHHRFDELVGGLAPVLPRLRELRVSALANPEVLRGLPLVHLAVGQLARQQSPMSLIAVAPQLETLELRWWAMDKAGLRKLFDVARDTRLGTVAASSMRFVGVNRPGATLRVTPSTLLAQLATLLDLLEPEQVARVVLQPWTLNAPSALGPPPTPERLAEYEALVKPRGMAFELEWR